MLLATLMRSLLQKFWVSCLRWMHSREIEMIDRTSGTDDAAEKALSAQFYMSGDEVRPFDRSLATVSLRTNANTPDGGYSVFLSASFGTQVVKLSAGDTEFDILFEIREAEIVLRGYETEMRHGAAYHLHTEVLTTATETAVNSSVKSEAGVSISATSPSLTAKRTSEATSSLTRLEMPIRFDHAQIGLVKIGDRTAQEPLTGGVVRDYEGWFALPNTLLEITGIRAELNITEHWVRFLKTTTESQTKLGKAWNFITDSNLKEHEKKKLLFSDLLRRLSIAGLQTDRSDGRATLDVSAIVCATEGVSQKNQLFSRFSARSLRVDETPLLQFLECEAGSEQDVIRSIVAKEKRTSKIKAFVPRSPVASALEAYKKISSKIEDKERLLIEQADQQFGANEIRDLLWLGLISNSKQGISTNNPYPNLDLDSTFTAVLQKQNTIQYIRNILEEKPNMKSEEIGRNVGIYIGRNWKTGTQHSAGHRLRSWTGFAYKEILGAEIGTRVFTYLKSSALINKKKGSPALIIGELKAEIGRLKASGLKISEIAREVNISPQVIYNYKSKYPREWDQLGH